MKKEWFGKLKNYLLIILSATLIFTAVKLYHEKQENTRQYELFLSNFYYELSSTNRVLHSIVEQPPEENDLEQGLLQIERGLERTSLMLDVGRKLITKPITQTYLFSDHPIGQFADDDTLTSDEVHYLKNLMKNLDAIQARLYSEETRQVNTDLSISAFNNILDDSGPDSEFLTLNKSVAIPFEIVDQEHAPNQIQNWIRHNKSSEEKKVFIVDGNTYIVMISDHDHKMEITDINRTGDIIAVYHDINSVQSEESFDATIAKLEMETERSFQFTTPVEEEDTHIENTENMGTSSKISDSASVKVELISPERLPN